jgi:ADP-ribose pyrophosphatase YjhB (NUDIX family)
MGLENIRTVVLTANTIIEKDNKVLLILREIDPYKNRLTLPGGHVEVDELVEDAAIRETKEETGFNVKLKEISGVYSDLKRDPRYHSACVVFVAEIVSGKLRRSFEGDLKWYSLKEIDFDKMGFDHGKMLKDYIKWKKSKGTFWTSR